jgi:hypothetical protein
MGLVEMPTELLGCGFISPLVFATTEVVEVHGLRKGRRGSWLLGLSLLEFTSP